MPCTCADDAALGARATLISLSVKWFHCWGDLIKNECLYCSVFTGGTINPLEFLIIILSRMFTLIKSPNVLGLICLLDLFAGVKKCPGGKDGTEFSLIFFRSWSLWFNILK